MLNHILDRSDSQSAVKKNREMGGKSIDLSMSVPMLSKNSENKMATDFDKGQYEP